MVKSFQYYRPKTRAEALKLLADPTAKPLVVRPKPLDLRRTGAGILVDLSLLELDYIRVSADNKVQIGALTTLQDMVDSPLMTQGALSLMGQSAQLVATPGIRNLASLWGVMQASGGPPELIITLLILEAELVLIGKDEQQRQLSYQEFTSQGAKAMDAGEILVEACLAPVDGYCGWALERVARTPRDEAIVAAVALVEISPDHTNRIKLALAGAHPFPLRLLQIEGMLKDGPYDEQIFHKAAEAVMAHAQPTADFRGGSEYRQAMAGLVVQRALRQAWKMAENRQAGR